MIIYFQANPYQLNSEYNTAYFSEVDLVILKKAIENTWVYNILE